MIFCESELYDSANTDLAQLPGRVIRIERWQNAASDKKGSNMKDDGSSTTAGEMADWLGSIPRDTKIRFQGGLTFYRFKFRDDDLVQIEFNERVQDAMTYFNEEVLKEE